LGILKMQRHGRRGISLFVVMAVMTLVLPLAITLQYLASQSMRHNRQIFDRQIAAQLTRSAIACAIAQIQENLSNTSSEMFRLMLSQQLKSGTRIEIDHGPLNALAAGLSDVRLAVEVFLDKIEPLDPDRLSDKTGGFDEAEKKCLLRFKVSGHVGSVSINHTESRKLVVTNLVPGILGKFSFFVKNVDRDRFAYNTFANNINGWAIDSSGGLNSQIPLIFKNGGELDEGFSQSSDSESWKKRGYIYLGGGPVSLNLTAGNDEAFGENFHFFKLGVLSTIPGYYDTNPPKFFTPAPDFSVRHNQSANQGPEFASSFAYCLKHVISGFFYQDEEGFDMNRENRLRSLKAGSGKSNPMFSSILHLYGTRSNPSPTLVLGEVYRRYADYTGIVLEATGNDVRDAILAYLQESNTGFSDLTPVPKIIQAAANGDLETGTKITIETPDWQGLFSDFSRYRTHMSQVTEEPYLRSHDFMHFREEGDFHPSNSCFASDSMARTQTSCELLFHSSLNRKKPMFSHGSLAALPVDFLQSKAVFKVTDDRSLFERFTDEEKNLNIDSVVVVEGSEDSTVEFYPQQKFQKGGIIIVENGNILVRGIRRGMDPDQFLVIVALKGNIEMDLSQGVCEAYLVALNGRVVNRTPAWPVDIQGGLAVSQFPPDTFPKGGRIAFNSSSDPTSLLYPVFYRAFVADIAEKVESQNVE